MNNFIFENTTKTFFGEGCVREYLSCLTKRYGRNVLFAYGGGSVKRNGIYDEVMESLEKAGKNVTEFSGIMENPTYAKVLEGAELARKNKIDMILGVVVTVAGTGSEMNGEAVFTNEALKIKTGRDYPRCNPKFALLDPIYTMSVSKRQMVSGGFDTLSHIMEIYFSAPDEDNVSDDLAEALMKNVIRNLRRAIADPNDYAARSNLMWDASMAENRIIKLGKRTDFECHNMEDQLGAYTDCSHGEGLAVLHPAYYRHIYRNGISKFKRFAVNVWGISEKGRTDEEAALAGVEALADLKEIAESCGISGGSYKQMTQEEIFEIFRECY